VTTPSTPASREAARRQGKKGGAGRELLLIVAVALVLSVLVRTFVAQAFYVPSSSMENTLQIQDRIIASKLTTQIGGVHRGEIVVFTDPGGWLGEVAPETGVKGFLKKAFMFVGLLPSDTGEDLVKRVIGVGGDHIVCCDAKQRIIVNGVPLTETYIKPDNGTAQVRFDIRVPQGRVFVMGDNRADSADSRYHLDVEQGTVPLDNVVGRVAAVIWPMSNWSGEPIPAIFENPDLDTLEKAPTAKPTTSSDG
jgi:signal peptidase I